MINGLMVYAIIFLAPLTLTLGCLHSASLESRLDVLEQQQARQYYLLRCSFCDVYSKPGTKEHEDCILMETRRWLEIKKRRGWQ